MSYSTIKAVWLDEKHSDLEELRNSHGTAPIVWDAFSKKYLGLKEHEYMLSQENTERLWLLYKRLDIPMAYRAVLMITYDNSMVFKKDYKQAALDIRQFLADFDIPLDYVNHWPRIAEIFESNPDIPALALYCMSVSEDPFDAGYDEHDEPRPTEWEKFWSVYDKLPK